ncbi:MAG: glycosyltransferase [Synergistaceae bacterium]|nr:glycosyltransferase [Synergistaceae bacterium]
MYVLVVTYGYPSQKYQLGIFEFDQAKALHTAGYKVIFAAVDLRSIRRWRKWGLEHLFKDGIEIYAINIPLGRVPRKVLKFFGERGIKNLYKKIKKDHGEPDIIHAHFLGMGEIALALREMTESSKFVLTEHSSALIQNTYDMPSWVKASAVSIYLKYDKVIAVSETLADKINSDFNANAICIPNMYDDKIFYFKQDKVPISRFQFVFVGNLIKSKSPVSCIESFYNAFKGEDFLTPKGGKICLSVIGDGPEREACIKTIEKLGIKDTVKLWGRLQRAQIVEIMNESRCFVLPSKYETFGVVYIEAMACGLPVIATRCGGPESFVDETNGILIPVEHEPALVSAFRYMLENAENYDSEKISYNTIERFSPANILKMVVDVYEDLMNNKDKKEINLIEFYFQNSLRCLK